MNPKPTCPDSTTWPEGPASPAPCKRPEHHGTASERTIPLGLGHGARQIPIQEMDYLTEGVIVPLGDFYSDSPENPPASAEPVTSPTMLRNGCSAPQR